MNRKKFFIISLVCIVFLVIVTGIVFGANNNDILLNLYSTINKDQKIIKMSKGSSINLDDYNVNIDGYEFIGWFNNSDFDDKINNQYIFKTDNTLYAGYSKVLNINDIDNLEEENIYSYTIVSDDNIHITNKQIQLLLNLNIKRLDLSKCKLRNNNLDSTIFNNSKIKEIILPYNIEKIKSNTFNNCYNLVSITTSENLKEIESNAIYNCPKLKEIKLFNNLKNIDTEAINYCNSISEIFIPNSVEFIGINFIANSDSLEVINVDENNQYFKSEDDILYTKDKIKLIKYPGQKDTKLKISNEVKEIENFAFINSNINEIEILGEIQNIGSSAFENCFNLKKVIVNNSQNYNINQYAFYNCENLEYIELGSGLNSIQNNAFKNCKTLKNINILSDESLIFLGDCVFENCENLQTFNLTKNITNIGNNLFYNCKNIRSVKIDANINILKSRLFYNCYNLESVNINSKIDNIEDFVFYNCYKLKNISNLKYVEKLGLRVFNNCKSLISLNLENLKSIEGNSFINCESIIDINLSSVFGLDKGLLKNCKNLISLRLGSNLKYIEDNSIVNCNNLNIEIINNENFKIINGMILSLDEKIVYWYNKTSESEIFLNFNIEKILNNAFSGKTNIVSFNVDNKNLYYKAVNGILLTVDDELITYPSGLKNNSFTLSSEINKIKKYSIQSKYLENLNINKNIDFIENGSIVNCDNLKFITLPFLGQTKDLLNDKNFIGSLFYIEDSDIDFDINKFLPSTLREINITNEEIIDEMAFYGAINIEKVIISEDIKEIRDYAFYGCQNLQTITLNGKINYIGESSFEKCVSLNNINIFYNRNLELKEKAFKNIINKVNINVYYEISYVMTITGQTIFKNKFTNILQASKYWIWRFIAK